MPFQPVARAVAVLLALLSGTAAPSAAKPLPGLGPDDGRIRVDGAAPPWTAVARLQVPGVSRCTAILVGPYTALTAAHCLWSRRLGHFAPAASIHVLSRYAAGSFARHTVAQSYRVAPGFNADLPDADRSSDFAVLTLTDTLGDAGLALVPGGTTAGTAAMLGGYNQDRAEVIEADTACHVVTAGPALLVHDCAGTRGTSGAPVLIRGPDGVWRVAGMQVGAFSSRSGGVAVAAGVLQDALDHAGDAQ